MKKNSLNYSNFIFFLKFSFPTIAIILLIVLFFVSPSEDFGESVSVSTENLELDISFQIKQSKLRGITEEGYKFNFDADKIEPISNDNFSFEFIKGNISYENENFLNLSGNKALLLSKDQTLEFFGNLELETNNDIIIHTEKVVLDLKNKKLTSDEKVNLNTPIGSVSGNSMIIEIDSFNNFNNALIFLKNKVKMDFKL